MKKCLRYHARHDLWGGLYYLRTSIVHNRVIATSQVAKCKIIKWFKPDDPISLIPEHMRAIFLSLLSYRNELFKEQFPGQYLSIGVQI